MADSGDAPPEVAALFAIEYPRLVGAVGLLLGDGAEAEDIAQEAFVRLCQHWQRVKGYDRPGGWLHHVALNLARNRRRSLRRSTRGSAACTGQTDSDTTITLVTAMQELPVRLRKVIIMRFFLDMSVADVAAVSGVPVGTIKSQTREALELLRRSELFTESEVFYA